MEQIIRIIYPHGKILHNDCMNTPITLLQVAVASLRLPYALNYLPPENCQIEDITIGARIMVPLKNREVVGVITDILSPDEPPTFTAKPAIRLIDHEPLISPIMMKLLQWASQYYHHPLGDVIFTSLPILLRKGQEPKLKQVTIDKRETQKPHTLNAEQQTAVDTINHTNHFQTFLLEGVTGSGKTEVYLQVIDATLQQGKQALVLVPEISLTPQTVSRFSDRFNVEIAVLHSQLKNTEKRQAWLSAREGHAKIIIGTRSAIFTPMKHPGIIIIDEEHDSSFKQQTGLRYAAKSLAAVRGKLEDIPLVLGTATPSMETLHNVDKKNFTKLHLSKRAGNALMPIIKPIDIRGQRSIQGISDTLLTAVENHLANNKQVLLYINRRGYAPLLICHQCGWSAQCDQCDTRMIVHRNPSYLLCHHCGKTNKPITHCPSCESTQLLQLGVGTERLEEILSKHFPSTTIVRVDRDNTRQKGSLHKLLETIQTGKSQILIGTQMLAKGHHFPNLSMVGIIDGDDGIYSTDFRALERMAQLITQVSGRAGRTEEQGEVYIQTHNPENILLTKLINEGYIAFAYETLKQRQAAMLPPYQHFALLRAYGKSKSQRDTFLKDAKSIVEKKLCQHTKLFGPIPSPIEKRQDAYHAQLLLQSPSRKALQQLLSNSISSISQLKSQTYIRWSIDVDPIDMY